ncbi:CynX/NimT family MFS transporter [Paenibacillus hodogayensis]|uniref:CynX/NimT family MFS transporter n=1 Tax=Paenibacillus hodogayensis TaxID=279208 RepID=A0ABV5VVT4_9BACL
MFYWIVVLFIISLNLRPSITSVGPLLDVIKTDLGMSGAAASLLTTLPVFCMGLFALLSIRMGKRLGIERSLLLAMLLIGAATLVRAFTGNAIPLLVTALFSGMGIGIAGPLLTGYIKKYFPDKLSVTSVYSVSMVVGAAVASSFSIPLFHGMNGSWQKALSFWSIFAFIAAALLLPLLGKSKGGQGASSPAEPASNPRTNPKVYWFMLFFGCMAAIFYSVTAWLAFFVKGQGLSQAQSGLILTLFTVIQVPVSLFMPMLVRRTGNRMFWLLLCGVSELIGLGLLLLHLSPWVATLFLGIGAGGLFPLALLLPLEEAAGVEEATSWSANMQFGGFMLGSLGPVGIGLTIDAFGSITSALLVIALMVCLMIVTILRIGNNPAVRKQAAD